jgi:hypothetical protein
VEAVLMDGLVGRGRDTPAPPMTGDSVELLGRDDILATLWAWR